MTKLFRFIIFIYVLICSYSASAQTKLDLKHEALAEKIYLQLDNTIYTTDKTIWFKAVLANAVSHNLEISSGVLYVDLINSMNEIVDSKIIKINKGIGKGFFDLSRDYINGKYEIRAYTEWNKNFGDKFITKEYIRVFAINSSEKFNQNIVLNSEIQSEKEELLNVSLGFYPEGGKIIEGLPIKIGFKATDNNGKGIKVNGDIINKKNEVITSIESNEVGLGCFQIDKTHQEENYRARLLNLDGKTYNFYNLPKIHESGHTLSIVERGDVIIAGVKTNTIGDQSVILEASVRGKIYFEEEKKLLDGKYIFTIPKTVFPNGVIIFKLKNYKSQPISERLFFNQVSKRNISHSVNFNKKQYKRRESVAINLSVINPKIINEKDEINTSILVIDKLLYEGFINKNNNLLSYFLLSSDIKGVIEKAGQYFLKTNQLNIDYLMLTQGWRNYKYVSKSQKLNYKLEKGLRIKGVINVNKSIKNKESLNIIMSTLGDDYSIYSGKVSVPGSFDFQIGDLYGDKKKMIFKPTGLNQKLSQSYKITLSKKKELKPHFIDSDSNKVVVLDTITSNLLNKNRIQSKKRNSYYMNMDGVTKLKEVVIDAYKMTPKRKQMYDKYGKPNVVIDGKDIIKKTNKFTTGLYGNLIGFSDKVFIDRYLGNYFARSLNGGITMIVVDGVPVSQYDYGLVQKIRPEEVTSFEIIDNPKNGRQLYATVFGAYPYGPFQASIISIYTKLGKGIYSALDINKGDEILEIPVFSVEKEFYIPSHDNSLSSTNPEPDLRSTVYWNPDFKISSTNSNKIKYSHSDNVGDFIVIIETISKNGLLGYHISEYSVLE